MTDTATARTGRPSPRPRPAGVESRPAGDRNLQLVPPPDGLIPVEPATGNPQPETPQDATPTVEFPQVNDGSDGAQPGGVRVQVSGLWVSTKALGGRTRDYWTPPTLFTDQPPSLVDLADYARYAPWTAQDNGLLRKAGIGYYYAAYGYTMMSRYREWVAQRPGRLAAHLGGVKLLALTTPGIWVVDHLVYPVAQFAGHVFL